jgi:zinc transport system ATP-binding protein
MTERRIHGPAIELDGVSLTLGATRILENVSFSVAAGSIHCVIGANGGGKTSLVRSMLGQMPHTGRIQIQWHDNRVVGYVPQILDFDKTLPVTVNDFMAMACQRRPVFLGVSKSRRQEIGEVLERLGLAGKGRYKLGTLSGGERQRVLFAQALIPEPALLVLDEPMTGLDVVGHDLIERSIVEFARAGGTVVWINHDIVQVKEIADTVTYVDREVRLQGNAREVLESGVAAGLFPSLATALPAT